MNQYLELFLSEAHEILTGLNQGLIQLEANPRDKKCIDEIFRFCHTLKGNAAAMGYERVVHLAHAMENLLGGLRAEKINLTASMAATLFEATDFLEQLIEGIQQGKEVKAGEEGLIARLKKLLETTADHSDLEEKQKTVPHLNSSLGGKSVRINLERLESLMNIVGELHISQMQLSELSQQQDNEALHKLVHEMGRITNKLEEETMLMRLLPLKFILSYFPRMVHDDAQQEGKEVNFVINGADIGMDRAILDEIKDPLIHILRNAVSHGIEPPSERVKQGKPAQGTIELSAYRERNGVIIKIQDDGAGMDLEKIKKTLIDQNLLSTESLAKLSEQEVLMAITLPGFSLSKEVTERAGRGVGMDAVKNKIATIGGHLSIKTELGKGTTFILQLPISMAIIRAVLAKISNEVCAIPLFNVVETLKIKSNLIKQFKEQEIAPYREGVLPLIRLREKLGFRDQVESPHNLSLVICEINHQKIGFIVDEFLGQQEIVVKNLARSMRKLSGISGAAILGSGRVAMILDMASLIH